jgi:signal transduction histidine kinase
VTVNLTYLGSATRLTVADDGQGLALASLTNNGREGQGMANMRERARLLGGDLVVLSEPERGLRLELTIPCDGCKDREMMAEEL